jgi:hypothetical protein
LYCSAAKLQFGASRYNVTVPHCNLAAPDYNLATGNYNFSPGNYNVEFQDYTAEFPEYNLKVSLILSDLYSLIFALSSLPMCGVPRWTPTPGFFGAWHFLRYQYQLGYSNMTVNYLLTKARAINKSPAQIVDELVSKEIAASM